MDGNGYTTVVALPNPEALGDDDRGSGGTNERALRARHSSAMNQDFDLDRSISKRGSKDDFDDDAGPVKRPKACRLPLCCEIMTI